MTLIQPNMPVGSTPVIDSPYPKWIAMRITSPMSSTFQSVPKSGVDNGDWFGGDQSNIWASQCVIPQGLPVSTVTSNYFNWEMNAHLSNYWVESGYSGFTTKTTGTNNAGQPVLTVRNNADLAVGMQVIVGSDTYTIASLSGADHVTMTTNLVNTYAAATTVTKGNRTFFADYFSQLFLTAGGDAYSYMSRVTVGKVPDSDQTHFSWNATGGLIGGDLTATTDAVYMTGVEIAFIDQNFQGSHDIAVTGDVRNFNRTNDTGSHSCNWIGSFYNSIGTKYAESCHVVSGKWKGGLDTIMADFGTDQAAVKLAANQRIFFNGTFTPDEAGYYRWGQNPGDVYMDYSSGLDQFVFTFHNVAAASFTDTNWYLAGQLNVKQGNKVNLDNGNTGTYLYYNGTNILLFKNGVQVATW